MRPLIFDGADRDVCARDLRTGESRALFNTRVYGEN